MTSSNSGSNKSIDSSDSQSDDRIMDPTGIPAYSSASNQIITEYGKQNMFATQVQPQLVENYSSYPEEAEKTNGRWTMIVIIVFWFIYYYTTNYSWNFLNISCKLFILKFFNVCFFSIYYFIY